METAVSKIVGTPNKQAWAQVHTFKPTEEEKLEKRGEMIAILSVSNIEGETEAVSLGREVINRVHEEYYGREEGTPFEALKKAVERVYEEFSPGANLEIVSCVLWDKFSYFVLKGGGKVSLWRDGSLVTLLQTEGSLSGKPKEDDVFVFGTNTFFGVVEGTLSEALGKAALISEVADNIGPAAHKGSYPSLAGAILKIKSSPGPAAEAPAEAAQEPKEAKTESRNLVRRALISLARRLPEKALYVKSPEDQRRRTAVSVGAVLLVLLFLSIGLGLRQKNIRVYRSSYEDRLVQAETFYNDALLQKEVNLGQARESFLNAKGLVEELRAEGVKDARLEELRRKIGEGAVSILGIVETPPEVFHDLSLIRSGIDAEEMAFDDGVLAVLDGQGERIISVTAADKETRVLAGKEDLGNPRSVAVYSNRYFSLGKEGIVETARRSEVVVSQDPSWGEIVKISVFAANIYLLDKNGQIWRYPGIEGGLPAGRQGFGSRQRWLGEGVSPDFSGAADFAIDGSIWVLSEDGSLSKFTRGAPDAFRVKNLDRSVSRGVALYTDEELDSLFILDEGRVVEIKKDGEYQKQYVLGTEEEIRDIAVAKDVGKIFLLTPTKILEVPLQ